MAEVQHKLEYRPCCLWCRMLIRCNDGSDWIILVCQLVDYCCLVTLSLSRDLKALSTSTQEFFCTNWFKVSKDVIVVYSLHSFPWIQNPEHVYNQSLECLTGPNMFKKRHHCAVALAASALLAARPFLPLLFSNLEKKTVFHFLGV